MTTTSYTASGIAYDRAGPTGGVPVVLIHAGVADRRMWDELWPELTTRHDVVRLDLRGFGDSARRPTGELSPVDDVLETLDELGIEHCHMIGASYGAGVAAEVVVTQAGVVSSLLLVTPGGSLIPETTTSLRAFADAEDAALEAGDLDAAVEANLATWVDGPHRDSTAVDPRVRRLVGAMQRRAFELTHDWDDIDEAELDPPVLERLDEITIPTLVLVGGLDLDAILAAADRVTAEITDVRRVDWADTAHMPTMERPKEFAALLAEWFTEN